MMNVYVHIIILLIGTLRYTLLRAPLSSLQQMYKRIDFDLMLLVWISNNRKLCEQVMRKSTID
jgi:hypothetical protein